VAEESKHVLYADKKKRVLICEDDSDIAALLRMILE
jgi:PleD family two-component response regulator